MKDLMLKFSCMITGDDYQLMKTDTPSSKKKIKTLVSVLFLPVIMWVISLNLLISGVLQGTQKSAMLASCVVAAVIFIVERSIIMSNGSKAVMRVRIFLGFLIAILGSLVFDEVIFKSDIDQQLTLDKAEQLRNIGESVDDYYKGTILSLEQQAENKRQTWISSLDMARQEADGSGGSHNKGVSAITTLKLNIANQNEQDYKNAKGELAQLLEKRDLEKVASGKKIETSFNDHALLLRIKAMFDLVLNNGWMLFVYLLFTCILFVLEFLVVILKMKLPKSNYELKLEAIEEIGRKRLMRLVNSDQNHFEGTQYYAAGKSASLKISKLSSASLFN
jgi:hypothetical protein